MRLLLMRAPQSHAQSLIFPQCRLELALEFLQVFVIDSRLKRGIFHLTTFELGTQFLHARIRQSGGVRHH
jgi:hypothetical protein